MKKILILATGGTISSIKNENGLVPENKKEILKYINQDEFDFELTIKDILLLDSSNIQPEEWKLIATEVFSHIDEYDAIIITHGTDTIAYTSSMLSFMLQNPNIPIIFTGSQLPISHPLTDAISNLKTAFTMALSNLNGIFLAFDRKIYLGCRAVKVRTSGFNAFESINYDCIAYIDSKGLNINYHLLPQKNNYLPSLNISINTDVFLLKLTPTTPPKIIDSLIKLGIRGLIIEAFGIGGIQHIRRDFVKFIEEAINNNITVVMCSQCLYEKADFTVYEVGMKVLQKGIIEALDMTSEACVTKLMWALGQSNNPNKIRSIFFKNIAGEISI